MTELTRRRLEKQQTAFRGWPGEVGREGEEGGRPRRLGMGGDNRRVNGEEKKGGERERVKFKGGLVENNEDKEEYQ